MIANVVRNVGKMREVGFQPCVVIMLGLESRDFGLFVLFIEYSVVTTINYVFVCPPEGLPAGLTLHVAFLVSLFRAVVVWDDSASNGPKPFGKYNHPLPITKRSSQPSRFCSSWGWLKSSSGSSHTATYSSCPWTRIPVGCRR